MTRNSDINLDRWKQGHGPRASLPSPPPDINQQLEALMAGRDLSGTPKVVYPRFGEGEPWWSEDDQGRI